MASKQSGCGQKFFPGGAYPDKEDKPVWAVGGEEKDAPGKPPKKAKSDLHIERPDNTGKSAFFDVKKRDALYQSNPSELDSYHFDDTELMFAVSPGTEQTDRQKECTNGGPQGGGVQGKLAGFGPSCSVPEIGHGEYHDCVFTEAADCWGAFQACTGAPEIIVKGSANDRYPAGVLPYGRENDKQQCENAKKDCLKKAKKKCACEDCVYESCMSDCGDTPGDGGTKPTTPVDPSTPTDPDKPEYRTVPGITSAEFSQSTYYVPRPRVYGRYIVSGNVFWLGALNITTVQITEEENRGDSVATVISTVTVPRASFAVGLSDGPVDAILRVWLGDTLLFNNSIPTDDDGNVVPDPDGLVIDEIENSVLFSNNTDDPVYYDTSKIKITFFSGREDQVAPAIMGDNAPAYRGMAYLLVENFNVAYVGGRLPEIKVELVKSVSTVVPQQSLTLDESTIAGMDGTHWIVDKPNNLIYAPTDGGGAIRRIALDTLTEIDQVIPADDASYPGPIDITTMFLYGDGNLAFQFDTGNAERKTYIMDSNSKALLGSLGNEGSGSADDAYLYGSTNYALTPTGKLSLGYHGYKGIQDASVAGGYSITQADYGISVNVRGFVQVTEYDAGLRTIISYPMPVGSSGFDAYNNCVTNCMSNCFPNCLTNSDCAYTGEGSPCEDECQYACEESCNTGCEYLLSGGESLFATLLAKSTYTQTVKGVPEGRTQFKDHLYLVSLPSGDTQGSLKIKQYLVSDSGKANAPTAFNPYSNYLFTADVNIPASVWGSDTTRVVGQCVFEDVLNKSMIIFLKPQSGHDIIISVKLPTLTVNWTSIYEGGLPSNVQIPHGPVGDYWFIDDYNNIVKLDLTTGETEIVYTLSGIDAPLSATSTQYYDPFTASIVYFTEEGTLHKVYVSRYEAGASNLAQIVRDLCEKSLVDPELIDVTDLEDVAVDGYIVDSTTKPRDALDQLLKVFAVTAWEDGNGLVFKRLQDGSPVFEFDADNYNSNGFVYTREDQFTQIVGLKFTYPDIANQCRPTSQQVKQAILRPSALEDVSTATYQAPIIFATEQDAVNATERMYAHLKLPNVKGTLGGGYSSVAAQVGDIVSVNGKKMRVFSSTLIPQTGEIAYELREDFAYVNDYLSVTIPRNASTTVQRGFVPFTNTRPRAFMFPPLNDDDAFAAGTEYAVFYVGVENRTPAAPFTGGTVGYKFVAVDSTYSVGPTVSEALHLGVCVNNISDPPTSDGTPDYTNGIDVRFNRLDTVTVTLPLMRADTTEEVVADKTRNLISVGDEILQWTDFVVDPIDPRRVTLTGLVRGRCGTEVFINYHAEGEEVVLITETSVVPVYANLTKAMKDKPVSLKVFAWANIGQEKKVETYPWSMDSLSYPAPVHVKKYHVANGDIKLEWVGRSIYGGELVDGVPSNPLSPTQDVYNDYTFLNSPRAEDSNPYGELYAVYIYNFDVVQSYGGYKALDGLIKNRWLRLSNPATSAQFLVTGQQGLYIKKSVLQGFGITQDRDIWVAVVRMGGPNMLLASHPSFDYFPVADYPEIPPSHTVRVMNLNKYMVVTPGRMIMPKASKYIVVREI